MVEKFKPLTQAQKNKLRRKAVEALHDENYGDDGDGFHEYATAQAVIALVDENAVLAAEVKKLKSAGNKLDVTPAPLEKTNGDLVGYIDADYADMLKDGDIDKCYLHKECSEGAVPLYLGVELKNG